MLDEGVWMMIFEFLENLKIYRRIQRISKKLFQIFEKQCFWDLIDLTNSNENSTFLYEKLKKVKFLRGVTSYCKLHEININDFFLKCNENLEGLDLVSINSNVKLNSFVEFNNLKILNINHENLFKLDFESMNINQIHIFNGSNKSVDQLDVLSDSSTLQIINLYYYQDVNNEFIDLLKTIKSFKTINLWFCALEFDTSEDESINVFNFANFNKNIINHLKYNNFGIDLYNLKISSWMGDVDEICKTFKNHKFFESIDLSHTNVTDEGLSEISNLINVKYINIEGCEQISTSSILKLIENSITKNLNLKKCSQFLDGDIQYFECFPTKIVSSMKIEQKNEEFFHQEIDEKSNEISYTDWNKYLKKIKSDEIKSNQYFN